MKKILLCLMAFLGILANAVTKTQSSPVYMAIFKSMLFGEIRNKMGGLVYSRNKSGAYIRQRVSGVNPKTVAQILVRTLMTTISQGWRGLTAAERLAWNTSAPTWVHMNVFNDNAPLSGFGLFCRLCRNLQTISQPTITTPPIHGDVVGLDSLSLVADTTAGTLTATFAPVIPGAQVTIIYATPGISPGVNFVKSEYRKIHLIGAPGGSPLDVATEYIAVFGALPGIGDKVYIKLKPIVQASGQDGMALEASDIAV